MENRNNLKILKAGSAILTVAALLMDVAVNIVDSKITKAEMRAEIDRTIAERLPKTNGPIGF